jgi:hypothetical protein
MLPKRLGARVHGQEHWIDLLCRPKNVKFRTAKANAVGEIVDERTFTILEARRDFRYQHIFVDEGGKAIAQGSSQPNGSACHFSAFRHIRHAEERDLRTGWYSGCWRID